jgi:ATP-dependent Clp protease ATP-binding subunit ClpX
MIAINTENILFICGGAFDGIAQHIANRLNTQPIGFKNKENSDSEFDKENLLQYVSAQDLKAFGLIPELIGRLPIVSYLNPLTREMLYNILTTPKNALVKQYTKLFKMEDIDLTFDDDAINYIVDRAMEFKLGARGLRSICESIMTDAMFELPSSNVKKYKVTLAVAKAQFEKNRLR